MKYKPGSEVDTTTIIPKINTERTKLIQMRISNGDRFNIFGNT